MTTLALTLSIISSLLLIVYLLKALFGGRSRKYLSGLLCLVIWSPAFAFDTWAETKYESGESIYVTEPMPSLIIGQNGVGLAYLNFFSGRDIVPEKTILTVDGKDYPVELYSIAPLFLRFKDGTGLTPAIANAKKISLKTRQCSWGACVLSKTGGTHKVIEWEFEQSLSERFKDYQERMR